MFTDTLAPGVEKEINLSKKKSTTTSTEATHSILESDSEEAEQSFENELSEQISKNQLISEETQSSIENYKELTNNHSKSQDTTNNQGGKVNASYGGVGGEYNKNENRHAAASVSEDAVEGEAESINSTIGSTLEQGALSVSNAMVKQANKVSSQRNVTISTTTKMDIVEESLEQHRMKIKNPSITKAMNFLFCTLVQEYHIFRHITNFRIILANNHKFEPYQAQDLKKFVEKYIVDSQRSAIGDKLSEILEAASTIEDYQGRTVNLLGASKKVRHISY